MAKQRHQLVKIAPCSLNGMPGRVGQLDGYGVIVEAAQVILRISFHVGGVGCRPVTSVAYVAEHMERGTAEWIAALVGPAEAGHYIGAVVSAFRRTSHAPGDLHAGLLVCVACAARDSAIASSKRQAAPIENSPARNRRQHAGQAFVVLVTAYAISLHAEMRPCDERIGTNHLHVEQRNQDD